MPDRERWEEIRNEITGRTIYGKPGQSAERVWFEMACQRLAAAESDAAAKGRRIAELERLVAAYARWGSRREMIGGWLRRVDLPHDRTWEVLDAVDASPPESGRGAIWFEAEPDRRTGYPFWPSTKIDAKDVRLLCAEILNQRHWRIGGYEQEIAELEAEVAEARAAERAEIVAMLRRTPVFRDGDRCLLDEAANAIEAGFHAKKDADHA